MKLNKTKTATVETQTFVAPEVKRGRPPGSSNLGGASRLLRIAGESPPVLVRLVGDTDDTFKARIRLANIGWTMGKAVAPMIPVRLAAIEGGMGKRALTIEEKRLKLPGVADEVLTSIDMSIEFKQGAQEAKQIRLSELRSDMVLENGQESFVRELLSGALNAAYRASA